MRGLGLGPTGPGAEDELGGAPVEHDPFGGAAAPEPGDLGGQPVEHDPFAPETAAPAPRKGLIQLSDLDQVLPEEHRRVGSYQHEVGTKPVEGGLDWDDLDMTKKGSGIHITPERLQQAWDDAREHIGNWSPEQKEALDKYFADHPEIGPGSHEFWNQALSLPDLARYWYEISTRAMQKEGLENQPPEDGRLAFRVLAGTSPNAEPQPNMRRTLGVLSEHVQNKPSSIDLTTPGSVRMAFGPGLGAPKIGNFAGTFEHIAGLNDKAPLSVNDRQVADIHKIDREDFAKNPALYGMVSQFYQNLRDAENAARPGVAAGTENPLESWQLQAPGWVQVRGEKREGKAGEEGYDDYAQVIKREKQRMEDAGIDTSPGIFSREVLSHPDVPNLMSGTRQRYLESPIATVETMSKMTPEGLQASELLPRLKGIDEPWARKAQDAFEGIQRRAMRALATGSKNSVVSKLVSAVLGAPAEVSRIDSTGYGQFEGDTSPNMRIPMWARVPVKGSKATQVVSLNDDEIHPVLAALGHDLGQKAMAAARFRTIDPSADPLVMPQTYSVFLPERDRAPTPIDQLHQFGRSLALPLNIQRGPTGTLADINIGGFEGAAPSHAEVVAAANQAFGDAPFHTIARDYSSHYLTHPEHTDPNQPSYDTHLADFWDRQHALDQAPRADDPRGIRRADWDAARRLSDFESARSRAREIAAAQQGDIRAWLDKYADRLQPPARTAGGAPTSYRGRRGLGRDALPALTAQAVAPPPPELEAAE